jgi:hypothetical protein
LGWFGRLEVQDTVSRNRLASKTPTQIPSRLSQFAVLCLAPIRFFEEINLFRYR